MTSVWAATRLGMKAKLVVRIRRVNH